jgi:hypothetical protein
MRVKQRVVLWGALGVLVAGAAGLVVASGGGGDGDSGAPALPLSVGSGQSGGADDARAASVAPMEFAAPTTYVPADDLPPGGGTEPAYRLANSVDEATVRDLAAALGIEGDPTEQDGMWHVASGDMALDVYEAGASWTAYRNVDAGTTASPPGPDTPVSDAPAADAEAPVAEGEECVQRDDATECTLEASASGSSASSGVATGCPVDPAVLCPDPRVPEPAPERPADLPSEEEARRIALDLLAAAGTDVEGADVQVTDGGIQWAVTVEPRLGGLPASGLAAFVAVGAGGRIDSASGYVGPPEELGDYDLIGTRAALDRLNDGTWGYRTMSSEQGLVAEVPETTIPAGAGGGASGSAGGGSDEPRTLPAPADDPATTGTVPPTTIVDGGTSAGGGGTQIAPGEPAPGGPPSPAPEPAPVPEPEPVEVAVTDAEVVLVSVPSWDDTGTYLVPGYQFTADDRSEPMVPAVTDDVLAPPPGEPGGQPEPEPAPLPAPVEPEPRPATPETTVAGPQPDPAGTEVDITLWHCGIEPLEADGQRWVADPPPFDETNAPPELTRHGTVTVAPDGGSATYTDGSGITVDLVPVGDDWQPPPCD